MVVVQACTEMYLLHFTGRCTDILGSKKYRGTCSEILGNR